MAKQFSFMDSIKQLRNKTKNEREKELVKQSLKLRGKSPKYSLKIFFDLCKNTRAINKLGETKRR